MHTLTVKLKQHTPLIHFQHDQEGATLRASEVKPKLDKFILNKLTPSEIVEGKNAGWIKTKNDKVWLDYKMRIEDHRVEVWDMTRETGRINNRTGKPITESIPLFFGNMHKKDEVNFVPKKMVFAPIPFNLIIQSTYDKIIEFMNTFLSSFFLHHNFGTRQSKGFGSYMLETFSAPHKSEKGFAKFNWALPRNNSFGTLGCYYDLFAAIDFFYKTLRSGINQNNVYFKSLMYFYALDLNEYWDKRTIRYEFGHFTTSRYTDKGENADLENDGNHNKAKSKLYRDMLGLSSIQTWKSYNDTISKDHMPVNPDDKIDRFKSPILIKPIYINGSFDVYLIPSSIPNIYLNAKFAINSANTGSSFDMNTPAQFDVKDFLSYITDPGIVSSIQNMLEENLSKNRNNKTAQKIVNTLLSIYKNIQYVE